MSLATVRRVLLDRKESRVSREKPVPRDLPVLPVPPELRDRLDQLELMEKMALLGLMELQVHKDPRETPGTLVLLARRELLDLLELLGPRVHRAK